jgi:hypothetical protein
MLHTSEQRGNSTFRVLLELSVERGNLKPDDRIHKKPDIAMANDPVNVFETSILEHDVQAGMTRRCEIGTLRS